MTPREFAFEIRHEMALTPHADSVDDIDMMEKIILEAVRQEREEAAQRCEHYAEDVRHGLGIGQPEEVIELLEKASKGCADWVRRRDEGSVI